MGLADDATAAQTNPAGLVVLARPEVAFEFKFSTTGSNVWRPVTAFSRSSRLDSAAASPRRPFSA
ncbi:MAG: hypothetical protein NZ742_04420 [Acidobacteria bacterium]|nr:hypothetical protein [Acidobacteriota bacterium]MDW7984016.1 hypothetical protein [Acidobacteriota bacterium]